MTCSKKTMITQLEDETVKLIVAGEVYVKPTHILKELIDNSLDAGAKSIRINIANGGYKSITVSDNGSGIRFEDRIHLCKRFRTSKIRGHEDLRSLKTFGFRGEALSLLASTADVNIASRFADEETGWTCHFRDGKLTADVKLSRDHGTCVSATNIFRRHSVRRQTADISQEKAALAALVTDLAIQFSDVSFAFVADNTELLLATQAQSGRSVSSRLFQIKKLYGQRLANGLLPIEASTDALHLQVLMSPLRAVEGATKTVANFTSFVNDRLVQWSSLKRAIRLMYHETSPKDRAVFVYIDIRIPTELIDPNVDPTKSVFVCKDEHNVIEWTVNTLRQSQESAVHEISSVNAPRNSISSSQVVSSSQMATSRQTTQRMTAEELRSLLETFNYMPVQLLRNSAMVGSVLCGVFLISIEEQLVLADIRSFLADVLDAELNLNGFQNGDILEIARLIPPLDLTLLKEFVPDTSIAKYIDSVPKECLNDREELCLFPFIIEMPSIVEVAKALIQTNLNPSFGVLMIAASSLKWEAKNKQTLDEKVWHHFLTASSQTKVRLRLMDSAEISCGVAPANEIGLYVVSGLPELLKSFERC
eukprot:Gregarina_sp_Poly_1__10941@NODE_85_length_15275_cov_135_187336_g73_i0_p3_GENE_NODE_85_length_15275_cov_135_187336_g73_i0NODE_85_length_15275_cov_135_187336_g73_i0_p3_ORF_typecomplete_len592_score96_06HATPase_c_3/PF13589_6/4_8e24DNA_mis_repair/PF01119_19/2_5e20DNA_mis_repair/PF01119_19/1_2e04HATPase_c/PF02518_26/3_7e09Adap_comp_sub/PF00928_21/0_0033_NODE_85_length_15275_cov_135_187336_g73_i0840410179